MKADSYQGLLVKAARFLWSGEEQKEPRSKIELTATEAKRKEQKLVKESQSSSENK